MKFLESDWQARLLAAMLKGDKRASLVARIEPDLFDPELQDLAKVLRRLHSGSEMPTPDRIRQAVRSAHLKIPERVQEVKGGLTEVDSELISQLRVELMVRSRITECSDFLQNGDIEAAADLMGVRTKDNLVESRDLGDWDGKNFRSGTTSCGFKHIDGELQGGLCAGELGFIMGRTGAGKSAVLCSMAVGAMLTGLNVVYVTAELSAAMIEDRCVGCITGIPGKAVKKQREIRLARLRSAIKRCDGGLHVIYVSPFSTRLISIISREKPDVLFVDAPENMRSEVDSRAEYRFRMQAIIDEMLHVSALLQVPTWCTWQSNREGFEKMPQLKDTAESLAVARGATIAVSLERINDYSLAMQVVKNRVGPEQLYISLNAQFDVCRFKETKAERLNSHDNEGLAG